MSDRNEILINFQAITGIEDVAACFDILEHKDWDLSSAVNSFFSENTGEPGSSAPPPALPTLSRGGPVVSEAVVDLTTEGSSRNEPTGCIDLTDTDRQPVQAEYSIRVNHEGRLIHVHLPGSATVSDLKDRLYSHTGIPPLDQDLTGWPFPVIDRTRLGCPGVIPEHILQLTRRPQSYLPASFYPDSAHVSQGPPPYSSLKHGIEESTPHPLSMPLLVSGKKVDLSNQHGVFQVNHRSRALHEGAGVSGLSGGVVARGGVERDSGVHVAHSSISRSHGAEDVTVIRSHSPSSSSSQYSDAMEQLSDEADEHPDLYESMDDSMFITDIDDNPSARAMKRPLMSQGSTEPSTALQEFSHNFEQRYGPIHPLFYVGSLSDAVRDATNGSAMSGSRKPMFIYLHHDGSVLSNVFCSQLLCSDSVVNYLSRNFITWAWDLTLHEHRIKLLKMVEESFGKSAKSNVDEIRADHLPCILIVYKVKGAVDIRNIIQGETNLDALMTTLITAVEEHNVQLEREIQEEQDRIARENMIAEQNRAYQESLDADREKERQRVEKEKAEEEEKQARIAIIESMSDCVPEEPPASSKEKLCTFRIRFPDGELQQRRFLATNTLQDLFNFLGSKEFLTSEYKILRSFPRKDLTEMDLNLTLEQAQLCPQETLFLEER